MSVQQTPLVLPTHILTERLVLRAPLPGDGAALRDAVADAYLALKEWMPWANTIPTEDEAEETVRTAIESWHQRDRFWFFVFEPNTSRMLGSTGLERPDWAVPSVDIGYWLRTSCVGHGYITEAANALTRYAFDVFKCNRVTIHCDATNLKSKAVAERLGFTLEGCLRNHRRMHHGALRDTLVHARIGPEGLPTLNARW